jgi:hypothetical protein
MYVRWNTHAKQTEVIEAFYRMQLQERLNQLYSSLLQNWS